MLDFYPILALLLILFYLAGLCHPAFFGILVRDKYIYMSIG